MLITGSFTKTKVKKFMVLYFQFDLLNQSKFFVIDGRYIFQPNKFYLHRLDLAVRKTDSSSIYGNFDIFECQLWKNLQSDY